MPTEPPAREDTYVINPEDATEMTRLMHQDRLMTRCMGGIHPEQADLSSMGDMLDIACGPGGWVLDVAHTYPKINVVGVDISHIVVQYARAQAWSQGLENASFRVMNVLKPLEFEDNSFDLVNARFLFGFMARTAWPNLVQECLRVLRPGGIIRLTEPEINFATTPAFMKLYGLFTQALKLAGMGFSADGHQANITPMLRRLLRDAGCQGIGKMAHVIDFSAGEEAHHGFYQDFMVAGHLLQPFIAKMKVAEPEELEQLYQETLIEMMSNDFCAVLFLLTAWGEKPRSL